MSRRQLAWALALLLAGCGSTHVSRVAPPDRSTGTEAASSPAHLLHPRRAATEALVTAETENRLLAVELPSGRLAGTATLPADPENVAVSGDRVVVVSARAGTVSLLARRTLRRLRTFRGFGAPHIPAISPDGHYAYVTDDARGTVTVISLAELAMTSTAEVGSGAHHLAFTPDGRRLWVALGESASRIVVLDTTHARRPRVLGGFDPGFKVHDLLFAPDGRSAWLTSADGPEVTVLDARTERPLFRVPVGPPPQHVVFSGAHAYLTSGYAETIERVSARTGRGLVRARSPYGSFELDAAGGYVTASSLLRGTLAIYDVRLRLLRVTRVAGAARDVVISAP